MHECLVDRHLMTGEPPSGKLSAEQSASTCTGTILVGPFVDDPFGFWMRLARAAQTREEQMEEEQEHVWTNQHRLPRGQNPVVSTGTRIR